MYNLKCYLVHGIVIYEIKRGGGHGYNILHSSQV